MLCAALCSFFFFFNDTATTEIYTLSLHDALPILSPGAIAGIGIAEAGGKGDRVARIRRDVGAGIHRRPCAVTCVRAGVGERLAGDRHELPRVRPVVERQLQDAKRAAVSHLAIGPGSATEAINPRATGADYELADPTGGIRCARR